MFKKKLITSMLALGLVTSSMLVSNADTRAQQLEVHFINVGQGDATYIELPDGTDMLIDAGEGKYGSTVVNYLNAQEKGMTVDYLIATHPDSDHVGGMQEVFKQMNVKNFYYPQDAPHNTQTWNNVLSLAKTEGGKVLNASSGTSLKLGGAVVKFVQSSTDYKDNNDDSVVTLIDYNNTEILVTGDMSGTTEQDMVNQGLVQDVDVLKVAHHGSKSSSTQVFLNKAKAENAVISVGKDNNYGHPNADVIKRLTSSGSTVWRTDVNGNIVVKSDGNNINISGNGNSIAGGGNTSSAGKWVKESGSWYYLKGGVKQTGWIQDAGKWYYTNSAGIMLNGWQQVNGRWYYLEASGTMATGWKQLSGKWYYLNSGGDMATGWKQISGKWYHMYGSGVMATNTTIDGWKIDGSGVGIKINNSGSSNNGNNTSQNAAVYVTPSGKSYHLTKSCTTLKRSKKILGMTLQQAKAQGKSDPCNICVK